MKSVSGKYFLLNFGLTHTIYIMIDWGQAGLCRAGQGQGRENSSADSNPWSNPGPSTARPLLGIDLFQAWIKAGGERAWPCCTQPALLRSVPIREGRIGMRERCSRLCHTAHRPRYEPIFALVTGDDDVFLILTALTGPHVTLLVSPLSPCWPDQCQCVTASRALYTCTLHMSVLAKFHPLRSLPWQGQDLHIQCTANDQATIIYVHTEVLEKMLQDKRNYSRKKTDAASETKYS